MKALSITLTLALLAAPAAAGDLDMSLVPASARWVAHLDVEALLGSKIHRLVREHAEGMGIEYGEFDEIHDHLGLDPMRDILSVTLFGTSDHVQEPVALIRTTAVVDGLEGRLQMMPNYHACPSNGYTLHSNGHDQDETWYAYVHRPEGSDERWVIASNGSERVTNAIQVLERSAPSLANAKNSRVRARPMPGSFFFAATSERFSEFLDFEPTSNIARLAQSIVVDVGEDRGDVFIRAQLEAETLTDATNMASVLKGGLAILSLATASQEMSHVPIQDLIQAVQLHTDGSILNVGFRYNIDQLLADLKAIAGEY